MSHRTCRILLLRSLVALGSLFSFVVHAQTAPTAQQRFHVQAFGMASYVDPDYYSTGKNAGGTIGVDLDGYHPLRNTSLGLDIRYAVSHGTVINQSLISGGPRLSFNRYRLQPYVDYQFGYGKGTFNLSNDPQYVRDNTGVRGFGGGFDYMITRFWGVRADVQEQRWRFTHLAPYFYPVAASVGVSYQVHLRSRFGPE